MADSTPKSYHTDPTLYLYTSLTAGSSHIITATSRLETILKANKVPFLALDVATDEKARMLWGRRAGKRKLPGLVRMGMIVGDLEEVEEWNEYGELKEHVSPGAMAPAVATPSSTPSTPSKTEPSVETPSKVRFTTETPTKASQSAATGSPLTIAMRQAGAEAAKKASDTKSQAKAKILGVSQASNDTAKKVENSSAPGLPPSVLLPPSGTMEAPSTSAPEIGSTTTKSTEDDVETTKLLTKPRQDSESSGKGNPSSVGIVQSGSQVLPEVNESLKKQKGSSDTPSHVADRGSEGGDDDPKILSNEASDKEKHQIEEREVIKADGEITEGCSPES